MFIKINIPSVKFQHERYLTTTLTLKGVNVKIMSGVGKKVTVFDADTGEIIRDSLSYGTQNGDGWMIVYKDAYMQLLRETANPTILRIFGSLMTKQTFDGGVKSTKKAIYDELGIERTSAWKAFKWLKENHYVKEIKTNGQTEFLLNPSVTTCGKNKNEKIILWNEN